MSLFRVIYTFLSALIILGGSYLAIMYAQGNYRFSRKGVLPESGLLSANSFPTGAQVYIDGELVTATDDTIYLEPGTYQVRLQKDGYSPWEKTITLEKELVTQTDARLFPAAPSLTPLTFTGVENLLPSPDGRKIVYYTASASAEARNGLYILDLNDNINPFQKTSRQIAEDVPVYELGSAEFIWSPDSSQLMILSKLKQIIVDTNQNNNLQSLPDISFRRSQILSEWEEEMYLRERQYLAEFPIEVIEMVNHSAKNTYISPDKKKLLYTATASATLENELVPPLPSTNTQPEERSIVAGGIYVYDREEDKNFMIGQEASDSQTVKKALLASDLDQKKPLSLLTSPDSFSKLQGENLALTALLFNTYHTSLAINTLQWFSDSNYLLFVKDDQVQIISYDGTNNTTLYSGPFEKSFIYPWSDGTRLIILTSFSPDTPKNLYSIELK